MKKRPERSGGAARESGKPGTAETAAAVQWFPGHMAKTRRLMQESLRQVDLVLELADARIPLSSRNPELDGWLNAPGGEPKPRILMLNKSDYADPEMTRRWVEWYREQGVAVLACDCRSGKGTAEFLPLVRQVLAPVIARREERGMAGRMLRIMVVGVPNVGKSSFINRMAGGKRVKVEDRPGVTRGKQWVSLDRDVELLDMPGVLWPKFEDPMVGEKLAFTGAVRDEILDREQLAGRLLSILAQGYPERLRERYRLEGDLTGLEGWELLEAVARRRGMLLPGGEVNTERAAIAVMDEYRAGKLGRLTLEFPPSAV